MVDKDDWRIAHGQGEWSRGSVVRWSRWLPTPTIKITPTGDVEPSVWNHDEHDLGDGTQSLTEGYAARGPRGLHGLACRVFLKNRIADENTVRIRPATRVPSRSRVRPDGGSNSTSRPSTVSAK